MKTQLLLIAILLTLVSAFLPSPEEWLERGFDVRDGVLKDFAGYNVQVQTKCNILSLTKEPHNYNGTVLSGYLKVGKGSSVLGFIFYGKQGVDRKQLNTVPTIIWLNGGPGSTSQLGNLMQLGPFWISESETRPYNITRNKYSWTKNYNVLFMDQPVGTGLSYADPNYPNVYPKNMDQVATDFYNALKQLYNNPNGCFQYLNIRGDHPLFVIGESYAGKYVPAIGERILKQASNNGFLTGLKGIAIGDGFTHPFTTLSMMGEYAYNFGLIDYQQRAKIEQIILNATYQQLNHRWKDLYDSFYKVLNSIVNGTGGVNVYDITKYKRYPTKLVDQYFSSQEIQALYALDQSIKFNSQSGNVGEALREDFMQNYVRLVQNVLIYYNIPVLIYTGQNDLIVETPGTLRWVERLHYKESAQFRDTFLTPWKINNNVVGFKKKVGNLELRTVNDAGHLVPMDQGEAALNMVDQFIRGALSTEQTATDTD